MLFIIITKITMIEIFTNTELMVDAITVPDMNKRLQYLLR